MSEFSHYGVKGMKWGVRNEKDKVSLNSGGVQKPVLKSRSSINSSFKLNTKTPVKLNSGQSPLSAHLPSPSKMIGGGGGGVSESKENDDELLNVYAKAFKLTLKKSKEAIKSGYEVMSPVLKQLGSLSSNVTKKLIDKGKELFKKLEKKLASTNKQLELEYNKKNLTKEEKRKAVDQWIENIKRTSRKERIIRERYE